MTELLRRFIEKYNISLDEAQTRAAFGRDGKTLLLAVPGSGKTTVMIARLGYLVYVKDVLPEEILAVTYSVAAANEMKSRYKKQFGDDGIEIRTIHGFCMRVINNYCRMKKRTAFRLLSEEDSVKSVIRKIMMKNGGYPSDTDVNDAVTKISYCVNMMMTDAEVKSKISLSDRDFFDIYDGYRRYKIENSLMDYDDMLLYAYRVLIKHKDVFRECCGEIRHICVDEAQDTSKLQHKIIGLIAENCGNLFMVGDEDQSIYGFRAAYPDALTDFDITYPDANILFLEKNYRSTANIVSVADAFISSNKNRKEKHMTASHGTGNDIKITSLEDLSRLPDYLYEEICSDRFTETAVLSRINDSLIPIIDILEENGVRFTLRGRDPLFFTHFTVTDIKNFFRFASDPYDGKTFMQIYYKMNCGISRTEAEGFAFSHGRKKILDAIADSSTVNTRKRERLLTVSKALERVGLADAYDGIKTVMDFCGYGAYMYEHTADMSKISAMLSVASRHRKKKDFFNRLDELEKTVKTGSDGGNVTLSTIHSAKGMEFDKVIVIDAVNGIFPSLYGAELAAADDETKKEAEEERRLFYVAVTRARKQLELIRYKNAFGELSRGQYFIDCIENITEAEKAKNIILKIREVKEGARIDHISYGKGTVISLMERPSDMVAVVKFDSGKLVSLSLLVCIKNKKIKIPDENNGNRK